jgi:hypothetical protein
MFMQNTTSSLEMMLIKYYNFDRRENTSTLVPYRVHRQEGARAALTTVGRERVKREDSVGDTKRLRLVGRLSVRLGSKRIEKLGLPHLIYSDLNTGPR